ncbi:MAG: winged helix-turn-helix transcriptional regulator [Alphaproteobacteria bacterium]|nr:winged helix-turn-helix transcriptional regulator [Alphaproteobacteria bacterium]
MRTVADMGSGLLEALEGLGLVVRAHDDPAPPASADLLALAASGVGLLRGWRLGGVRTPALMFVPEGALPDRRFELEPLVVLREPAELRAALDALAATGASGTLVLGGTSVDLVRRRVVLQGGGERRLSQLEVDLLAYLAARAGRGVGRDELLLQVWGHAAALSYRAVDMAVMRLRRKLEPEPAEPRFLLSSYGRGYRLVVDAGALPPLPPGGLVGRGGLLDALAARVDVGPVALVGPPGVGVRSVALALAHRWSGLARWLETVSIHTCYGAVDVGGVGSTRRPSGGMVCP